MPMGITALKGSLACLSSSIVIKALFSIVEHPEHADLAASHSHGLAAAILRWISPLGATIFCLACVFSVLSVNIFSAYVCSALFAFSEDGILLSVRKLANSNYLQSYIFNSANFSGRCSFTFLNLLPPTMTSPPGRSADSKCQAASIHSCDISSAVTDDEEGSTDGSDGSVNEHSSGESSDISEDFSAASGESRTSPLGQFPKTLTICGAGHVSHYLVGALTQAPGCHVKVFAPYKNHGSRLREQWASPDAELRVSGALGDCQADLSRVEVVDDPSVAFNSDCVVFALPPPAYFEYLREACLHAPEGTVLLGLPGVGCFEWAVAAACKAVGRPMSSFKVAFTQECPLSCRTAVFGQSVFVRGKKVDGIMLGCLPAGDEDVMCTWVEAMLLGQINVRPGPALQVALSTSIMIGHGFTLQSCLQELDLEKRNLYQGELLWYGQESRNRLMDAANVEWRAVAESALEHFSEEDCPPVDYGLLDFLELWHRWYPEVKRCKTLAAAFAENSSYQWTTVPFTVEQGPDGSARYLPNTKDRKFVGDVPFGLCLVKILASQVGVSTPVFDECIQYLQGKMNKDYLRFNSDKPGAEVELGEDLKKECHFVPILANGASLHSFLEFYRSA